MRIIGERVRLHAFASGVDLVLAAAITDIKVVILWPNRLIGDKWPGATLVTFTPQSPYTADSPLLPSGFAGTGETDRQFRSALARDIE